MNYRKFGIEMESAMLRSIGDLCASISKYAADDDQKTLSLILRMAAMEAYEIADKNPLAVRIDLRPPETGLFDLDIGSDIVFSDAICAEFFGSSKRTARGVANADFINALHPDDRDRVLSDVGNCLAFGAKFDCKYRVIANGRMRWIHARGFCTLDKSGRPIRFPGAVTDITQFAGLDDFTHVAPALRDARCA
jgi:PAS domain-containing protein